MAYTKTTWIDRVVQFANRYKDQNNVEHTLTRDAGVITQAGTPINAVNMNNIENKIFDLDADDLTQYKRDVTVVDNSLNPTEVRFKRYDDTLYMKRNYSNPNSSGEYQTCIELVYNSAGAVVLKTITYTFTYLTNGGFDTIERSVT